MSEMPTPLSPPPVFSSLLPQLDRTRSMGVKLLVVCGLALFMMLPAIYVSGLVEERSARAHDVAAEISQHEGGAQTFLGPILVIPTTVQGSDGKGMVPGSSFIVFPTQADATFRVSTQERRRSLFKVPVFHADAHFEAEFDVRNSQKAAPAGTLLDFAHAEIVLGVSDARGALADATATSQGRTVTLTPATTASTLRLGRDGSPVQSALTLFGTPAALTATMEPFHVAAALRFSGAQRMAVLAYGKSTHVTVDGDWKDPGFDGGFLPTTRSLDSKGFHAEWNVPFLARGVRSEGSADDMRGLDATALGISFIEVADPYQSVNRALKYAALFVGMIFLAYFVFEVTAGKRVHPAQYVLVGVAQTIFYLLLLSLAERMGFDGAFLLGGGATVALLSANAGWVFGSRAQGVRALAVFGPLYGLIYVMLRLEDNALLVGAVASFAAVAGAMYLTRKVDWYSSWSDSTPSRPFAGRAEPRTSLFPGSVV